jgi:hypothetical protein
MIDCCALSTALLCLKSVHGTKPRLEAGRACPLCPGTSDIDLFRYCECVIDFDTEPYFRSWYVRARVELPSGCPSVDRST